MSEPAAGAPTADALIVELGKLLQQLDRSDLAQRATVAAARLRRPSTIVCVVGEFKQGKSSLVNALLGSQVCPVDDDLATSAITLVRYGEQPGAVVRRKVDGKDLSDPIPVADLGSWVSEVGNPKNHKGVERVEVTVPSPFLKQGLVIVDTPGMGGLGAGHAAATLGFLPFADGLIFVSDASAELSQPEVDFLRRAIELCPSVMFAQTKTDLFANWQKILELNKGHLARQGVDIPIVPVSSSLRTAALSRKDRELNDASRVPELVQRLGADVVAPAKANAAARSVADARAIIAQVDAGYRAEKAAIADGAAGTDGMATIERAKARIEYLRGPAAKWSVLVGDKVTDLSNQVTFKLRGSMREIQRMMDERIEVLSKGDEWDELARYLQTVVSDEVASAFVALEEGRAAVRAQVVELLQDEEIGTDTHSLRVANVSIADMWQGKSLDPSMSAGKKAWSTGITGLRGAQGGVMMFGMMGSFLPTAAGVLIMSNPVLLGVGALFGSMGLVEDRKRKVAARRQAARTQVRQFLDDVQFEVNNQIGSSVRDIQRDLRDEFGERLAELLRTFTEAAQRAQAEVQKSQGDRQARAKQLDVVLQKLAQVDAALEKVG
ncbi:MAG TPA: hypothetical protein DCR14_19715 [Acidimicrobiaceae bacterium]|nr:hypothetical protein [Acidimicrobiaceae bacterium]